MRLFIIAISVVFLSACSWSKPHEKSAQMQAQQSGLVSVAKPQFEASFILPGAHLASYTKIQLAALDLSSVRIIQPVARSTSSAPWALSEADKAYYEKKYTQAVEHSLIDTGLLQAATSGGSGSLLLKARLVEIAPLAVKDDLDGRPNNMDVYSKGFGRMTLVFELYDSSTQKLLLMTSDQYELGQLWEKNTRAQTNIHVGIAFEHWANKLKKEIERAR